MNEWITCVPKFYFWKTINIVSGDCDPWLIKEGPFDP